MILTYLILNKMNDFWTNYSSKWPIFIIKLVVITSFFIFWW